MSAAFRLGQSLQTWNSVCRVKPDRVRKLEKFHNVDAALAAFEAGHEGLVFAKPGSKVSLRHPCGLSLLDEKVDESLVTCRSKRFSQLRPVSVDAGTRNNLFFRLS
jgi:hypothetical protein